MLYRSLPELMPRPDETPRLEEALASRAEVATQIADALGGRVDAVAFGPSGLTAALWTEQGFPPWYRVVIWSGTPQAMTPPQVRIWGNPRWSATGQLAVTAFGGIRRGIVVIDPRDGMTRWWSQPAASSYRLLALGPDAGDARAVRSDCDGASWLVRAGPDGDDQVLEPLRPPDETQVTVVTWTHGQITLEGLLARPAGTGPHPLLVFLHGGPVGALACGEHPEVSPWVSSGFAVFLPDFRGSGIAGPDHMVAAFRRAGLPADDPEAGDVLTGVDMLVARGIADPGALVLFGHSYGGYLAGRIITRDHRFQAAVLCESGGDLRLLDAASQQMQAGWLGGDARQAPARWAAASPVEYARQIRTPTLLIYARDGGQAAQGRAWARALSDAGVDHRLVLVDGADHVFSAAPHQRLLHQEATCWFTRARGYRTSG